LGAVSPLEGILPTPCGQGVLKGEGIVTGLGSRVREGISS